MHATSIYVEIRGHNFGSQFSPSAMASGKSSQVTGLDQKAPLPPEPLCQPIYLFIETGTHYVAHYMVGTM